VSTYKGILIDPFTESITEFDIPVIVHPQFTMSSIRYFFNKAIFRNLGCERMDFLTFDKDHEIYLDKSGLLTPKRKYFKIRNYPSFLTGKAVICGFTGDFKTHTLDMTTIRDHIMFLTVKEAKALAHMLDQQNFQLTVQCTPNDADRITTTKMCNLFY